MNTKYKKSGFMLVESLLAVAVLGFAISLINQVLLAKIKRLHQDIAGFEIIHLLSFEIEKFNQAEKNEKIENSILNVSAFAIEKIEIKPGSSLVPLKKFIQPVKASVDKTIDGKMQKFSLLGVSLLVDNKKT